MAPDDHSQEAAEQETSLQGHLLSLNDAGDGTTVSKAGTAQAGVDIDKPYSCFTNGEKWGIISLISLASVFSPISTNIYTPAIPTLAEAFDVPLERINLTLTVYLVFQALSPSLWGAASDAYGRRPIYIINLILYILSCIGTALCPTDAFWLLLVLRIVQAAGGSATIALGTGVIADISLPHERGKFVGIFQFAGTFSTAIGPVLGGVFAYTLGWRSIFWFLTIFCGVVMVPVVFLLPETLRSLVGDGSIPPPMLNCTPQAYRRRRREERQAEKEGRQAILIERPPKVPFQPLASLFLLFTPDLGMVFFWSAIGYALWYAVITVFSTLLKDKYGLSDIIIGVCYIPNGVGTGISALLVGRFMDKAYSKEKARVGGDHHHAPNNFRLERTRFVFFPYQAGVTIAATLIVAWSMQVRADLAVPVVFSFFVGTGTSFLATTSIYGIDIYPGQGGAVTASFNLIRCASAAVSVAVIQVIVRHLGAGWGFVLLSGIWVLCTPLPIIVAKYGPRWRKRRHDQVQFPLVPRQKAQSPTLPALTIGNRSISMSPHVRGEAEKEI